MPRKKKLLRARVNVESRKELEPVYKWVSGYSKKEIELEKDRVKEEYRLLHRLRFAPDGSVYVESDTPPTVNQIVPTTDADQNVQQPAPDTAAMPEAPALQRVQKGPTFAEYATHWYKLYKEPNVRRSTQNMYVNTFTNHLFPEIGLRRIGDITADELQGMLTRTLTGKSSSLIDKVMLCLRQVFDAAREDDIIMKNPVSRLKPPEGTLGERNPIPYQMIDALTEGLVNHPDGLFPLMLLYTGMRRGEALGLKWRNVYDDHIDVVQAAFFDGNHTIIGEPKTDAAKRSIPLVHVLANKMPPRGDDDDFVFGGKVPYTQSKCKRLWERVQRSVPELQGASPHIMRHTYTMLLRRAGVDPATAQYLLGHEDYSTTANDYTSIDEFDRTDASERLATLIDKKA